MMEAFHVFPWLQEAAAPRKEQPERVLKDLAPKLMPAWQPCVP